MNIRSRHRDVTACSPISSDRRLTTDITLRISLTGNQQINGGAIETVLKTSSPEDIVVRDQTERFCELQDYFWPDRGKIRGSEKSDPPLAEINACREQWIQGSQVRLRITAATAGYERACTNLRLEADGSKCVRCVVAGAPGTNI